MKTGIFLGHFFLVGVLLLGLSSCDSGESGSDTRNNTGSGQERLTEAAIRLNLHKGDVIDFTQREEIDLKQTDRGMWGTSRNLWFELDYTITCEDVAEDGMMIIAQKWTEGRGGGMARNGPFEWDTSRPKTAIPPQELIRYKKLVGRDIKAKVMPNGEIIDIWNAAAIADAILYEKGFKERAMDPEEYKLLQEQMIEEVLISQEHVLDCILRKYPEGTLKAGQRWSVEKPATTTRSGTEVTKVTFDYAGNGVMNTLVSVSTQMGRDALDSSAVARVDSQIDAWGNGQMKLDLRTGLIRSIKLTGDAKINAQIEDRLWDVKYDQNMEGTITSSIVMR